MDPSFTFFFPAPLPFAPLDYPQSVDDFSAPPSENGYFPVRQWTGMASWDTGYDAPTAWDDIASDTSYVSPYHAEPSPYALTEAFDAAYDAHYPSSAHSHTMPDASGASHNASNDALFSSHDTMDAFTAEFDASASTSGVASGSGWAVPDHVTPLGADEVAPYPPSFVDPVQICDVVPPVSSLLWGDEELQDIADALVQPDEETVDARLLAVLMPPTLPAHAAPVAHSLAPEYVGAVVQPAQPTFGAWDALFASIALPTRQDDTVPAVDELVFEPGVTVKPSAPRPCKRQRAPDAEIYPAPPKKSKCAHTPSPAPSRTSRPSKSKLPKPIIVVPTTLCCQMPGCNVVLSQEDGAWRSHFKAAHHKEVCTDSACHDATSCQSARCPKCAKDSRAMPPDSLGRHMLPDSLGRHMLNKHIGVCYRCPLCGYQKAWRRSSCERHIETCSLGKNEHGGGKTRART